ncbi:hypothetical protein PROFUN_16043 [Planoprotostelium fungivorum]|uniref:Uncharacterized protein n=1 Tax=Planoprotostelium fungivorum TaxID=1890364 RepID=A0A2P6MSS0_9EUKA|nr:hypothetical protein PROFUN_16043 [Planoprotostelium fungivorum]
MINNLLTRPDVIVYAGGRDPAKATELQKLTAEHNNLHIVKLTSGSQSGGLDYVIAKAGIAVSLLAGSNAFAHQLQSGGLDYVIAKAGIAVSLLAGSNAFAHQLVRHAIWISVEYAKDDLVAITVHPGTVEMDMFHKFLERYESWISIAIKSDDSAKALLAIADKATRESQEREKR